MTETEAQNVLLRAALHQAQWTVDFLHHCLTNPQGHRYAYPQQTLDKLAEWKELAPVPRGCFHSRLYDDCPACVEGRAWRGKVAEARKTLENQ